MARSILEIDLKDEKFQKFLKDFDKYQEAMKKQKQSWKDANKGLSDMADSGAKFTQGLKEQEERLKKQKTLYGDIKKTTVDIGKEMKGIAGTTISIIGNLVKWTGIGGVLSGLIGLGGLWGIDRLAGSVSDARRSAQGLGVSVGQQSAYKLNFGRYMDAQSNLQAIADAKADYSKRWAFSAMGVNPDGQDPASLGVQMMTRAKQMWDKSDHSEQFAQSHGLLNFYTMDDLRRLGANSSGDISASQRAYGRDAGSLNVSDKVAKDWQGLSVTLERAKNSIWTVLVEGLAKLTDPLGKLSNSVVAAIQAFLGSDKLKDFIPKLGEGIENIATYLTSPDFVTDLKGFAGTVGTIVDNLAIISGKIIDLLRFLNVIPSVASDAITGIGSGAKFPLKNKNNELVKDMYSDFKNAGWREQGSAGVVANAIAESQLNPFASGDNGKAYGLFQLHADRQAAYAKMFGHTMQSVTDPIQAWHEQIYYQNWEGTHGLRKYARERVNAAAIFGGAYGAGAEFSTYDEGPKDKVGAEKTRGQLAQQVLITVNNNTGGNASVQTNQAASVK